MMSWGDRIRASGSARNRRGISLSVADGLFVAGLVTIVALWWQTRQERSPAMPVKRVDGAERDLYLEPGGLYTSSDIEANGGRTASEKFTGFLARHDFDPRPGDRLCPITRTKADERCDWVIGGRRYTFCCPPCIDEFVELAKRDPDRVLPPEAYTK